MSSDHHFDAPELETLSKLLPAYDIKSFIAKGGMGAVYRATQRSLDREVAIKILPKEFGQDAEFRKQFEAEAKAMAKLNHPNLVGVYDFGEVEGMLYIVMEYVPGKSLYYSAYQKAVEQKEAGRLALEICEGLAHAHEAGILHRDIKPANILLDLKARPKIGDFGLASAVEGEEGEELAFGTPGYTAPEVMKDASLIGKRSDVFSTGVILYELLTGEIPGKTYLPASQREKVDPRFDRIIRRATHPTPSMRYADAAAMAADLKPLLDALNKAGGATLLATGTSAGRTSGSKKTLATGSGSGSPKALATSAAGGGKPPSPAVPMVAAADNHSWTLMRNIVIIVVLLLAIWGMWGAYEAKTAENIRKQKEHDEEQARKKAKTPDIKGGGPVAVTPTPAPPRPKPAPPRPKPVLPPKPKTPLEVLADLKDGLFAGDRTEFPPGTEERGSSRFFFVSSPMNWQKAANFAEEHGGHLATCPTEPDSNWLSSKIKDGSTIWLGGGAIGRSGWGWVDGNEWTHRNFPTASGTSAAMTALGTLKARPPGEEMPFFIQWHMDAENPGSLKSQLLRIQKAINNPNPGYPPGTLSLDSRRYLLIARSLTWSEASDLAALGAGHLAVPSDQAETDYLQNVIDQSLPPGNACWLGGKHNGSAWAWDTNEPWVAASWADGSPNEDPATASGLRLIAGPAGGWDDSNPNSKESTVSLLIEWSNDRNKKQQPQVPVAAGKLAELRQKGDRLVQGKAADYLKELKKNSDSFKWDLDFWIRGLPHGPQAAYKPGVDKMKAAIRDDHSIPGNIPKAGMPGKAAKILEGYLDSQTRIHSKFMIDIENLRAAYLKLLNEARTELEEKGLKAQVQAIENELNACGNEASTLLLHFTGEKFPNPGL